MAVLGAVIGLVLGLVVASFSVRTQEKSQKEQFSSETLRNRQKANIQMKMSGSGDSVSGVPEYGCALVALGLIGALVGGAIGAFF